MAILDPSDDVSLDVESLLDDKPEIVSNVKISEELDASAKMEFMEPIKACSGVELRRLVTRVQRN